MGTIIMIGRIANSVNSILRALQRLLPVLQVLLAKYPALSAAALNVAVALAARFGFHASATELAIIVSSLSALLGAYVHLRVSPVSKPAKPAQPPVPPAPAK